MLSHEQKILKETLGFVLEDWAMAFADDHDCHVEKHTADYYVSIHYSGQEKGKIELWLNEDLAHNITMNVLGINEVSHADTMDAVKELANLVCGHFLTSYYDRKNVFDLSIPEVKEIPHDMDIGEGLPCICVEEQSLYFNIINNNKK